VGSSLFCYAEKVYMDDIEEILDEFMISLNTEVNDGSLEEVREPLVGVICIISVVLFGC